MRYEKLHKIINNLKLKIMITKIKVNRKAEIIANLSNTIRKERAKKNGGNKTLTDALVKKLNLLTK